MGFAQHRNQAGSTATTALMVFWGRGATYLDDVSGGQAFLRGLNIEHIVDKNVPDAFTHSGLEHWRI